jgi:hypothetical protein
VKSVFCLFIVIFLAISVSSKGAMLTREERATLTPEAEQALNRGLAATRQEDWDLAIKYFKKTQKASPLAPEVLFNLALAYDKAEGADLLAAAYYRAYLAMVPEAENKDKIRARIEELLLSCESIARKLVRNAEMAFEEARKTFYEYDIGLAGLELSFNENYMERLAAARIFLGEWNNDTWRKMIDPWDKMIRGKFSQLSGKWEEIKSRDHFEITGALRETANAEGLKHWYEWYGYKEEKKNRERYISMAGKKYPLRIISGGWMCFGDVPIDISDEDYYRHAAAKEPEVWVLFAGWMILYEVEDAYGHGSYIDRPSYWESFRQKGDDTPAMSARRMAAAARGMAGGIYHFRAMDKFYRLEKK